jgi:hypothetical protein
MLLSHSRSCLFVLTVALATTGCDKLKGAIGKGGTSDEGGTTASSGLLSLLGNDFEGMITTNVKSKSQKAPQEITFAIKKPKFRIEVPAPPTANPAMAQGGSLIIDPPSKKGWVLIPAQKMAMELDFDKMKSGKGGIPGLPSAPKAPTTPPKIDKTGKTDTVAGYTCDVWKLTSADGRKADVCVAEGITWFDFTDLGMGSPELALAAVATDANRFPLRLVSYDASGAEETRMEATKVLKMKLDDAQFTVPADFRTVDMAGMMGAMGAMGGPPGGMPSGVPNYPGGHLPPNVRPPVPPKPKH